MAFVGQTYSACCKQCHLAFIDVRQCGDVSECNFSMCSIILTFRTQGNHFECLLKHQLSVSVMS